ncbi:MAG: sigma-70 family RNA polymerase sigma factor [Candidatus Marinimicrobia bacterium]|jgi:RNA polymerase sigma-70 factor (ECF subfamily)|nr:sigma-70 family RNA polymerase sigma factor [Candidatus Neomarinimicrobiota bacterium]MCK9560639.1 sigma-70 family RNA polymerase sigma factor [Candidatus Neomarinimicrobiota bacterium]MDD5539932.1 sigma-70 family RNA polymerase sigma factor [Candidatus Neomarinimicrobiota bacterium]
MEKEEVELIRKIQGGNKMAFGQLMERYGERVMSMAFRFTRNHQDAEDLYQETFIKVYRNLDKFRFESEFFTWMYRILANQAFNIYNKRKRMTIADPGEDDYLWETIPAEAEDEADRATFRHSIQEQVDAALQQLSSQQRVVFVLKHFEGKKIKDIAVLLDCTEGTVKRYLFRATHKLQTLLAES